METIKTVRSKALIIFSALIVHVYGLIATIVACMYVWQLLLSAIMDALIEKVEALGANLPPEQRETIDLKVQEMREDEAIWERMNGQTVSGGG